MLQIYEQPVINEIHDQQVATAGVRLFIKREDKIHPFVSGNKWRKLKYNLLQAKQDGLSTLLTFGGAYSNHIYATAAAAQEAGFHSIGIIRGEPHLPLNPTLSFAHKCGMCFHYMDRITYRRKHEPDVINGLKKEHGEVYLLPEGGTNDLAIRGSKEIISEEVQQFDYVCLPVGTGGTMAGVILGMEGQGTVLGFSALKGDFLESEVNGLLKKYHAPGNWQVITDYHFGGYAKVKPELLQFINKFNNQHHVPLDPIYTGKMMYGIYDLIRLKKFAVGSRILAIHTGGVQGIAGMREAGRL